jgi:hypothetical protein
MTTLYKEDSLLLSVIQSYYTDKAETPILYTWRVLLSLLNISKESDLLSLDVKKKFYRDVPTGSASLDKILEYAKIHVSPSTFIYILSVCHQLQTLDTRFSSIYPNLFKYIKTVDLPINNIQFLIGIDASIPSAFAGTQILIYLVDNKLFSLYNTFKIQILAESTSTTKSPDATTRDLVEMLLNSRTNETKLVADFRAKKKEIYANVKQMMANKTTEIEALQRATKKKCQYLKTQNYLLKSRLTIATHNSRKNIKEMRKVYKSRMLTMENLLDDIDHQLVNKDKEHDNLVASLVCHIDRSVDTQLSPVVPEAEDLDYLW